MKNVGIKKIRSWETSHYSSQKGYVTKYQILLTEKNTDWMKVLECSVGDLISLKNHIEELLQDTPSHEILNIPEAQGEILDQHFENDPLCNECTYKQTHACTTCLFELDSPLERKLYIAMRQNNIRFEHQYAINKDGDQITDYSKTERNYNVLTVADFFIEKKGKKLCLYTDGHTYHEKTEEQAMRDQNIDRKLQDFGYAFKRYTGKEINEKMDTVITEIKDWIENAAYSYK